jgi:uncharacterized OB-fold protein
MGVTKPRQLVHMHSYGGEAPFFQALPRGELLATRCDNEECEGHGTIFLPFRIHCADCLEKATIIAVTNQAIETAIIHTFIVTERTGAFNQLQTPIRFVDIDIEGISTIFKGYMLGSGDPEIGKRVIPIFKKVDPTYTILDIAWVVEGTKAEDLPKGWSFATA